MWVRIIDENDNAPEFPEEEYVTELREGPNTVGAIIATVTAIDPDEGLNGTIHYAISKGNLAQTFQINSITVRRSESDGQEARTGLDTLMCLVLLDYYFFCAVCIFSFLEILRKP